MSNNKRFAKGNKGYMSSYLKPVTRHSITTDCHGYQWHVL